MAPKKLTKRRPSWTPLLSGAVGKNGGKTSTTAGCLLNVHLAVMKRPDVEALLRTFRNDQGFFVHFVEGSMVSLTISPTRGGND